MDLDQLAKTGEFIGGAAVLVTLAYLALQVRQGNSLARSTAAHHWTQFNLELIANIVEDRPLAELWVQGDQEFETLDRVDQLRLIMFEWRAFEAWHHAFHQRKEGILADHQWNKIMAIMEGPIGARQALRESWKQRRHVYESEYCELIDRHLGRQVLGDRSSSS